MRNNMVASCRVGSCFQCHETFFLCYHTRLDNSILTNWENKRLDLTIVLFTGGGLTLHIPYFSASGRILAMYAKGS